MVLKTETMRSNTPSLLQTSLRFCILLLPFGDKAHAEDAAESNFFAQYSVFTHHFFPSPVHVNRNHMVNLEWQTSGHTMLNADRALIGGAALKNSFGQPTEYLYVGQKWDVHENVYLKLTAGLLHGYKDPYQNKIPLNHYGIAPVIVPSIGLRFRQFSLESIFLSNRAVMLAIGVQF
jgi:hypothetical protein